MDTSIYRNINHTSVYPLAFGCMGLAEFYGEVTIEKSIATLEQALSFGINLIDTADMYGRGLSEKLVGQSIKKIDREKLFISTKVGFVRNSDDVMSMELNGRPEYIKAACNASLKRLGTDYIDIYFLHRIDPACPVEDSMGAMKELVQAGKVRQIGLSDTSLNQIDRASSVHPVSAYQGEYSLWHRDPEANGLIEACQERNITFMPYCPLGRGFLAGELTNFDQINIENDVRGALPRFHQNNFARNLKLLENLRHFCQKRNISLAQLALAWLLHKNKKIIPIVGMRYPEHVAENVGATSVVLTDNDMAALDKLMPIGCAIGEAYPADMEIR